MSGETTPRHHRVYLMLEAGASGMAQLRFTLTPPAYDATPMAVLLVRGALPVGDVVVPVVSDPSRIAPVGPSNAQVADAAAAWLAAHPPAPGHDGLSAEMQVAGGYIQWRQAGGSWANLIALAALKGDAGAPANTLIGTVAIAQSALVSIALGIREVTVALAGAVKGARYQAFCDSYKLNGGATVIGRPAGYALIDCVSNADGQVTISLNAPLLAVGASYQLNCSVLRINA